MYDSVGELHWMQGGLIGYGQGVGRGWIGKEWELMQYTGLLDKNGKEIYEGDIVKVQEFDDDYDATNHVVEYCGDRNYLAFDIKGWDGDANGLSEAQGYPFECVVIGNIYENPELLTNNE